MLANTALVCGTLFILSVGFIFSWRILRATPSASRSPSTWLLVASIPFVLLDFAYPVLSKFFLSNGRSSVIQFVMLVLAGLGLALAVSGIIAVLVEEIAKRFRAHS